MTYALFNFLRNKQYLFCLYITCSCSLLMVSCTRLVEVEGPYTSINTDNVYNSDETATSVLNSIYAGFSQGQLQGGSTLNSFMNFYSSLSADELTLYSTNYNVNYTAYYQNSLTSTIATNIWNNIYPVIYTANSAIENLTASKGLSNSVKSQLLGEAKFVRAFCHFYLANLYGDVPLVLTSDYKINATIARTSKSIVIEQVVKDLTDAEALLSDQYLTPNLGATTQERVAPIKWAATAMLARAYLYSNNWADAESKASEVINKSSLFSLVSLDQCFIKNNSESIWQLQPVNAGWNTEDARFYVIPSTGFSRSHPVYLSERMMSQFELGDLRRTNWIDSFVTSGITYYYPFKYKVATLNASVTEYEVVLRLAEQYLIRAEARVNLGKLNDGIEDLNAIRRRAGLPDYAGLIDKDLILKAIMHERQVELFTEWGHRWLDLKRTGVIDNIMSEVTLEKGGVWSTNQQLYPISQYELKYNISLVQNIGY